MIAPNAFKGNKTLETVTLGKYIRTIGKNAFASCPKLTTVKSSAGAFKGIASRPTIKCPSGKKSTYKTLLVKKGVPKKATFK